MGWVFDFYDLILVAFLLPIIETNLHIDQSMGGWLLGVGLGASGIGGIIFGWLGDLYGRKTMLTLTVLLFSFGMLITAFTQTAGQFIIARFITGIGLGGEWALGHALIAESVPKEARARWGAFLQSGEPVGVMLAAVVGFLVAPYLGWRLIFLLSSVTGLLALLFRRYLPESRLWQPPASSTWKRALFPFLKNYRYLLFLTTVLATLKIGTYWACYTWLPQFIKETYQEALGKSVAWIACGQLGQLLGIILYGYSADWIGRRLAFSLFSLLTAVVLFLLAVGWGFLFQEQILLFWLLMFLMGVGSGCVPGLGVILAETFPTSQRTFAMSLVFSIGRMLQVFSPVVVGIAVQSSGILGGLLIPSFLALLTAGWVLLLPANENVHLDEIYLVED